LNVFSFSSSILKGSTVFSFDVPAGSAVIINVSGNPVFANAGNYGANGTNVSTLQSVLWNFPSATRHTVPGTRLRCARPPLPIS
jgi:choice-of-anchor A domain-containing protein